MTIRLSNCGDDPCPDVTTVRDYDQLNADAKQYLAEAEVGRTAGIELPTELASSFGPADVINYTDYVQVVDATDDH